MASHVVYNVISVVCDALRLFIPPLNPLTLEKPPLPHNLVDDSRKFRSFRSFHGPQHSKGTSISQAPRLSNNGFRLKPPSPAHFLVQAALSKLLPLIRAYCPEFPWREDEFVVRDKRWINLSALTVMMGPGYFYEECLVDSKKGAKKFKSGKQFLLYVVVPEKQWDEVEQFRENLKALPSTSSPRRARALRTVASVSSLNTTASSGLLSTSAVRSSRKTTSAKLRVPASSNPTAPAIPTASKRSQHQRGNSLTFQSPPSKKSARAADPASDVLSESPLFTSPNRDHLKQALQSGGNTDLDVKSVMRLRIEQVEFYLIPGCKLAELIN
ncbi:hypothetical protein EV363DRAFT_1537337 [Boletus edulis]|uniref:Uncharacterized protein n=1 Tax=Boletus edulis BED1 TaxID=1328754 RepID=A0AAD4G7M1_BOLED|nr:hypothetical protein EV363DRAFT_1537337 [Boletus edulis]KAF8424002.1 hypothetical protein L210DRAFT_3653608 [Boletus edulis BED1]